MKETETCNNVIHFEIVDSVKKEMPKGDSLDRLADLFKIFGDGTRVRIICALLKSEMCVCDLAALLEMSQSAVSHQLRTLKQARLVKNRRDGKVIYYSLDDEHVENIFKAGYDHIEE